MAVSSASVRIPIEFLLSNLGAVQAQAKNFVNGLKQGFQDVAKSMSGSNAFVTAMNIQMLGTAVTQVAEYFNKMTESSRNTETALADLSALTGIVGEELQRFKALGKELAWQFGTGTAEQLQMFKGIVSRLGVEFGQNADAVAGFAKSVNILGKAAGLDAVQSMDALTTAILQFRVNLKDHNLVVAEAQRMINVMAEGAKQGASEIPAIAEALKVVGTAASAAKLSFEETNAALQVLARSGKFGAEAGTALRNVINRLQARMTSERHLIQDALEKMGLEGWDIARTLTEKGLGAALDMLREGMKRLGSDTERNVALIRIFGEEGMTAAGALLNQVDLIGAWSAQLKGTNTAMEQAEIRMGTTNEKIARFTNQVKMLISGVFSKLPSVFTMLSTATVSVLPLMQSLVSIKILMGTELVKSMGMFAASMLSKVVPSVVTASVASAGLGASMKALAVATWSALGPLMPYVLALGAVVGVGAILWNVLHKTAEEKKADAEATLQATQEQIKYNEAKRQDINNQIQMSEAWERLATKKQRTAEEEKAYQDLNLRMVEIYGSLVSGASSVEEAIANVHKKNSEYRADLEKMQGAIYQLKIQEIHERTEVVRANVEVEQEKVEDAISEIGMMFDAGIEVTPELEKKVGVIGYAFGGAVLGSFSEKMSGLGEAMKKSKTKEELMKYFGEAIDLSRAIKDPKERKKVIDAFRSLYEAKNKEFAQSEQENIEMFKLNLQRAKEEVGRAGVYEGVKFDLNNAEDYNKLVEKVAKENGISLDVAKAIVEEERKRNEEKEKQEQVEKNLFNQAMKGLEQSKQGVKLELLQLIYKQKTGQALTEEEKKRLEILKIQAQQLKMDEKALKEVEAEVDKIMGESKAVSGVRKKQIDLARERYEAETMAIENELTRQKIVALGIKDESERKKFLHNAEMEANRKRVEAFEKIYGISVKIDEATGAVTYNWDKNSKVYKEVNKDGKQRNQLERDYGELVSKTLEKVDDVKEKISEVAKIQAEIEGVKLSVEIGEIDESEGKKKLSELYSKLREAAQKEIENINAELSKIGTVAGEEERVKQLTDELQKNKRVISDTLKWEREERERQAKEIVEIKRKEAEQIIEQVRRTSEEERKVAESVANKSLEWSREQSRREIENERQILEQKKEARLITEQHYQNEIKRLEEQQRLNEQALEIVNAGYLEELQREQAVKELNIRRAALEERKALLEKEGLTETEEYKKILVEMDEVNAGLKEKGDILTAYSSTLQTGIESMILSVMEGNKEGAKQGFKEMVGTLIGILKRAATAAMTNIILGQLGLLGTTTGIGALLLLPAIRAVVTAGVNAILEPIIKSIAKFATGGRVDKPTMLLAGEHETEWIVRDQDIQRVVFEALRINVEFVTEELAKLRLESLAISDKYAEMSNLFYRSNVEVREMFREVKDAMNLQAVTNVNIDVKSIVEEIQKLRGEMEAWSGRVYVVSEDVKRELDRIEARRARLRSV